MDETTTGPYPRVSEPVDQHTRCESMVLFRMEIGKIAELWGISNRMEMLAS